jgi:hypothetical protein
LQPAQPKAAWSGFCDNIPDGFYALDAEKCLPEYVACTAGRGIVRPIILLAPHFLNNAAPIKDLKND